MVIDLGLGLSDLGLGLVLSGWGLVFGIILVRVGDVYTVGFVTVVLTGLY